MSDQESPELQDANATVEPDAEESGAAAAEEEAYTFEEDPSFDVDYKGDCAYEVKVSIPAVNETKRAQELMDELQGEAEMPGFRRGKAPRKLLEKKFGKAVRGDAAEKLVTASFQKLVKDQELYPIDMPNIDGLEDALDRAEGEPITCTFKFEVAPRCELGEYKGIEIERPLLKVSDEDIAGALEQARARFATYEAVEGVKAEEGDQVVIDFKGAIDGEEFQGGSAENYPYILGSGRFFEQFEAALKGVESGQEVTCDVPFPEDYTNKELAGKTAQFTIKVQEIKRRQLPELDDELAKQMGEESLDSLRERVAKELREATEQQTRRTTEGNAVKKIVENSTFELPKSLVESSAGEYYKQELRRLHELRVPRSEIEQRDEQIKAEAEEAAIENIKGYVAINEIGKAEGVEVTEEDFEKEAEQIQSRTGMDMSVISRFLNTEQYRDEYSGRIFRDKAMAVVLDNAKFIDKEVTQEELDQDDEASDA